MIPAFYFRYAQLHERCWSGRGKVHTLKEVREIFEKELLPTPPGFYTMSRKDTVRYLGIATGLTPQPWHPITDWCAANLPGFKAARENRELNAY